MIKFVWPYALLIQSFLLLIMKTVVNSVVSHSA